MDLLLAAIHDPGCSWVRGECEYKYWLLSSRTRIPVAKGLVERANAYLESSLLPG
jgi:hypothetical protein